MSFKFIVRVGVAVAIAAAAPAQAAVVQPFSESSFEAAQREGRPILVDVYADWCPTCRAQHQVLTRLLPEPAFKDLLVLKLNFDTQKDAWRKLRVQRQSTLIAFRGGKEVGRAIALTDNASIARLLQASVG